METCALIVLDEGDPHLVDATMRIVAEECATATVLDPTLVATWLEHRNDVGALAPLWERGYVVDTIEVAGSWAVLDAMRHGVIDALRALPGITVASVHQSHAYLDGACLYFTFAARPEDDVSRLLSSGLGVRDPRSVAPRRCPEPPSRRRSQPGPIRARRPGQRVRRPPRLKRCLDPDNLMNPGVLGLGGEPW